MNQTLTDIADWHSRKLAALWLAEGCTSEDASALLALDWPLIWSSITKESLSKILPGTGKVYKIIDARSELPPESHKGNVSYIYNVARPLTSSATSLLQDRRAAELENILEGWVGSIVIVGAPGREIKPLFQALSPSAVLYHIGSRNADLVGDQLAKAILETENADDNSNSLQLKNAKLITLDSALLEPISDSWDLLTTQKLRSPTPITQQDL
ncbi:hypothetical protein [Rhizobium leguminosarum]